jgi:poly-gamma-glutamate synthesis protein (capsule biosynthesis protein)
MMPPIDLAFVGDVMLGRGVDVALRHLQPHEPWGDVLPLLAAADVRIANLECALTRQREPWSRTFKLYHFGADPAAVRVLQAARIDACSLANNHTLDFEGEGLLETLRTLDAAGIAHAGAGRDAAAAAAPAFVTVGEPPVRIALLAFTDNEPPFAATATTPGTRYLPVALDDATLAQVSGSIEAARAAGADLVVVSNHWGPNMRQRPSALFRRFARAVVERGADVYYGHSAHLFQGIEVHAGKPILYDTGDCIDDYAVDPVRRNDWSFLFRIRMERRRLREIDLHPVALSYARVRRATPPERDEILQRMTALSAELGTPLVRADGHLRWG